MTKIIRMSAKKILAKIQELNNVDTLTTRKNILAIKRHEKVITFKVEFVDNKRLLQINDFWIKKIFMNATIHRDKYEIIVHEIRVKSILTNIKKKKSQKIERECSKIYMKLKVEKMKWLTKNVSSQEYASLILWVTSSKIANRIIKKEVFIEIDLKIAKKYDTNRKSLQCLKCQKYEHKTYKCKNEQRCANCAQEHYINQCSYV